MNIFRATPILLGTLILGSCKTTNSESSTHILDKVDLTVMSSLSLQINSKKVPLTKKQTSKIKKMSIEYLASSNFNSTGTGRKIKFNQNTIVAGYKKAIQGDHIEITFKEDVSADCHGGKVSFKKIVIGPFKKMYIGAPYAISDKNTLIGFGKYSGGLAVAFKKYISSILK